MKRIATVLILLGLLVGCGKPKHDTRVGVVDLDRVAEAMGWGEELNRQLQAAGTDLQAQLEQLTQNARAIVETTKQEIATAAKLSPEQIEKLNQVTDARELEQLPLTAEQRQKIIGTVNQANLELQNARGRVQPLLQQHRAQLIAQYRERVRPAVSEVAAEQGLGVVFQRDDGVLYFDTEAVDITAAVTRLLRNQPPAATNSTEAPFTTGAAQ